MAEIYRQDSQDWSNLVVMASYSGFAINDPGEANRFLQRLVDSPHISFDAECKRHLQSGRYAVVPLIRKDPAMGESLSECEDFIEEQYFNVIVWDENGKRYDQTNNVVYATDKAWDAYRELCKDWIWKNGQINELIEIPEYTEDILEEAFEDGDSRSFFEENLGLQAGSRGHDFFNNRFDVINDQIITWDMNGLER